MAAQAPATAPKDTIAPGEGVAAAAASPAASGEADAAANGALSPATKRAEYLSWDDYFMSLAFLSAQRSKVRRLRRSGQRNTVVAGKQPFQVSLGPFPAQDPSTQVGACIVDEDNRIVSVGYNGFPRGCSDEELPWARTAESPLDTKYMYVCHAEVNAVMNKNTASLKGARMYVALFPCNECAKIIIQSGMKEVVFLSDKYHDEDAFVASRRLFDMAGVAYRQLVPSTTRVVLDLRSDSALREDDGEAGSLA